MQNNTTMPPLSELRPLDNFTELVGVSRDTLIRWADVGAMKGTVRLKAWMGKEWLTTEAEVIDFIQRKTAARLARSAAKRANTPKKINTASHNAAKDKARKEGFQVK